MRYRWRPRLIPGLVLSMTLLFIVLAAGLNSSQAEEQVDKISPSKDEPISCQRIVSTAPSITEVLFALGLGERVKGVTKHCLYPPEVKKIAQVGGYMEPSYEQVLRLQPDLVLMLPEHRALQPNFARLGLKTMMISHKSMADILASYTEIGTICGISKRAEHLKSQLEARIAKIEKRIEKKIKNSGRPRVMICVSRHPGRQFWQDIYIAGHEKYYSSLLRIAGGKNSFQGKTIPFPMVTAEGIVAMNPEIIIDLLGGAQEIKTNFQSDISLWSRLDKVTAVKQRRVHILARDYVNIPGSRFILLLEDLAALIHPEPGGRTFTKTGREDK